MHLAWAAAAIDPAARVARTTSLHDGASPWLLEVRRGDQTDKFVLRVADCDRVWAPAIATAAAGLQIATQHNLPTARLIALDLDGTITGAPSLLETYCPGVSTPPPDPKALFSAGVGLAALHTIPLAATPDLPVRWHHTPPDDHPGDRRWTHRYQQAPESERRSVLAEFVEQHPWMSPDRALDRLRNTPVTALLLEAEQRIGHHHRPPDDVPVFLHADMWFGNTLWSDNHCLGLIDWKSAGVGHPGIDLGSLRLNAALIYGMSAAAEITRGWEETIGRKADAVAHWDAVAALYTPADVGALPAPAGREISSVEASRRRDAFLLDALDRLDNNR
ncbi:MAG TPA: aminoglycoside phosphotransferase family protein [Mycobacteriales bacterium]|nr:aminoglycoside phosphotransferase family protein [Mycobacteriales bacterium]